MEINDFNIRALIYFARELEHWNVLLQHPDWSPIEVAEMITWRDKYLLAIENAVGFRPPEFNSLENVYIDLPHPWPGEEGFDNEI